MFIIFTQGWEPLKCINKYFVFIYMQLQIWDFFYEIGRINTGETTYQKIFIFFFTISLYVTVIKLLCLSFKPTLLYSAWWCWGSDSANHVFPFASCFLLGSASGDAKRRLRGLGGRRDFLFCQCLLCNTFSPNGGSGEAVHSRFWFS